MQQSKQAEGPLMDGMCFDSKGWCTDQLCPGALTNQTLIVLGLVNAGGHMGTVSPIHVTCPFPPNMVQLIRDSFPAWASEAEEKLPELFASPPARRNLPEPPQQAWMAPSAVSCRKSTSANGAFEKAGRSLEAAEDQGHRVVPQLAAKEMAPGPNSNTPATLRHVLIRRRRDLSAAHAFSTAEELESWGGIDRGKFMDMDLNAGRTGLQQQPLKPQRLTPGRYKLELGEEVQVRLRDLLLRCPCAALDGIRWSVVCKVYADRYQGGPLIGASALDAAKTCLADLATFDEAASGDARLRLREEAALSAGKDGQLGCWPLLLQRLGEIVRNHGSAQPLQGTEAEHIGTSTGEVLGVLLGQLKHLLSRYWDPAFEDRGLSFFNEVGQFVHLRKMKHFLAELLKWRARRRELVLNKALPPSAIDEALADQLMLESRRLRIENAAVDSGDSRCLKELKKRLQFGSEFLKQENRRLRVENAELKKRLYFAGAGHVLRADLGKLLDCVFLGKVTDLGLGGEIKLFPPPMYNGELEKWEDWSWQLKRYVGLYKPGVKLMMDGCGRANTVITDEDTENGFEIWNDHLESDLSEFMILKILKNRHEKTTGRPLGNDLLITKCCTKRLDILCTGLSTPSLEGALGVNVYVDSDGAGCPETRKITSGSTVNALGSMRLAKECRKRCMFLRSMLLEAKLANKVRVLAHTDSAASTAAKSPATCFGTRKKTKHVELRLLHVQNLEQMGLLRMAKIDGMRNSPPIQCFKVVQSNADADDAVGLKPTPRERFLPQNVISDPASSAASNAGQASASADGTGYTVPFQGSDDRWVCIPSGIVERHKAQFEAPSTGEALEAQEGAQSCQ
ncbi:unnamed protein product, partial [Symbiodinium sp. KB8]